MRRPANPPSPAPGDAPLSKTRRKQAMHDLQDLGEALIALDAKAVAKLALPERLADAIAQARFRATSARSTAHLELQTGYLQRACAVARASAPRRPLEPLA